MTRLCFKGHAPKSRIDAALDDLLKANPPTIAVREVPRPKGQPGTPTKIYSLVAATRAKSAKSANSEPQQGVRAEIEDGEVCERSEVWGLVDSTVSTIRTLRKSELRAETRVSIDSSLSSHTSHGTMGSSLEAEDAEVF